MPAADLSGATGQFYGEQGTFEGRLTYDADDFLDRHEVGELVRAQHHLALQPTGTQTADSAARAAIEVSASPALQVVTAPSDPAFADLEDTTGVTIEGEPMKSDDSLDLIGRPLSAMAQGPFTDGTNGVGGGGGPDHDTVDIEPFGFDMDRRDEVFLNGVFEAQNISDGPVTMTVIGQHEYVVTED